MSDWFARLPRDQRLRAIKIMKTAEWNMYRHDARSLLGQLAKQIQKNGGERQRSEGIRLINRVRLRLKEWVD